MEISPILSPNYIPGVYILDYHNACELYHPDIWFQKQSHYNLIPICIYQRNDTTMIVPTCVHLTEFGFFLRTLWEIVCIFLLLRTEWKRYMNSSVSGPLLALMRCFSCIEYVVRLDWGLSLVSTILVTLVTGFDVFFDSWVVRTHDLDTPTKIRILSKTRHVSMTHSHGDCANFMW